MKRSLILGVGGEGLAHEQWHCHATDDQVLIAGTLSYIFHLKHAN